MDSYTVQYSARVRGCSGVPTLNRLQADISRNERSFVINNLEEDSDVSVTLRAVNIRGTNSAAFNTRTTTASMCMS